MTDAEARAKYVQSMAKLTVWIRQTIDGQWEAINWKGEVLATHKFRVDCESAVQSLARDPANNIYAYSVIVAPFSRRKHYSRPTRRVP